MRTIAHAGILITMIITLFACGNGSAKEKESNSGTDTAKAAIPVPETTVELTKDQMASIGVEIGKIEQKQLTATLRANGVLRVPNQNKARIGSLYSGVIKTLLVQPGNAVRKGQIVATISNPQFITVQEEFLGNIPRITMAQQELTRQQELNQGNAGILKNLQAAEANLKALQTRQQALREQIRLMGVSPDKLSAGQLVSVLSVRSPINGVVSNVNIQIGSYVDTNVPVMDIVDNSQLHLDLFVYEKDLPRLRENQQIHFTLTNNPGQEYDAQIYSLGSSFENESKAVSVHALVKGDKTGLIDGMNITALISLDKAGLPAVPNDAIVTFQGQDFIFVVTGEKKSDHGMETIFEKIPVAKGRTDVGFTQITPLKTVNPDQNIVTKGAFFVLAKMTNSGEGEHE